MPKKTDPVRLSPSSKKNQRGTDKKAPRAFAARLEEKKRESTLQLLFKAARLLDEEALQRVAKEPGRPRLRRSHTALFPHLDLEGTRVTDLADRLGVSKQAVSQLVDELETLEVLERVVDPEDARARRVCFTSKGRAGLLDGLKVLATLEAEYAAILGAGRMKALHDALAAIVEAAGRAGTGR